MTGHPREELAEDMGARIARDPRYRMLVRRRGRFTWMLSGVMLVVYFGYILLIAFDKTLLAQPIGAGRDVARHSGRASA